MFMASAKLWMEPDIKRFLPQISTHRKTQKCQLKTLNVLHSVNNSNHPKLDLTLWYCRC